MTTESQGTGASHDDRLAQRMVGTWKLISVTREEVPSGVKVDQMGPDPQGYITYGPEGRMMVLIVRSGRQRPAGPSATPTEAEALFRSVMSYGGTYTVSGNEVTHHVDISWNEAWTGTKQQRTARIDGNRVTLSTPVSPDPISGKMSVRSMVWEKL